MKEAELKKLQTGDQVFWTDPDGGLCSKMLIIQKIKIHGDMVRIHDKNGDYLECFTHELS